MRGSRRLPYLVYQTVNPAAELAGPQIRFWPTAHHAARFASDPPFPHDTVGVQFGVRTASARNAPTGYPATWRCEAASTSNCTTTDDFHPLQTTPSAGALQSSGCSASGTIYHK